jgi:VWFA-related protein
MSMRPTIAAGLVFLIALPALAQSSFFGEVMEVRVTNVDVIVTGRDGKPVPGLKIEDFELYENGVRKEITNFLEIHEDAAPALVPNAETAAAETGSTPAKEPPDIRRRQIVILFDNAAIHPFRRNDLLPHVESFVKNNVRNGDEVAIFTWASSLKAELGATSDFAAMEATLKRVAAQTTLGGMTKTDFRQFQDQVMFTVRAYESSGRKPPWSEAIAMARMYAMAASQKTRQRIEALRVIAASMRGAPGRKILVFVTDDFSSNPSEAAFAFLDSHRDLFVGVDQPAMTQARDFEIHGLVRDIADTANSSGVTIYPIDVGGKEAGTGFVDASESVIPSSTPVQVAQTANLIVNGIAAETGGVALYGSTNWKLAFDTISSDLNTYYSLGYRSDGEKKDTLRNIEVRLRTKPRYAVRMRHGVIEPSAASEMNDAVSAYLFRDVGANDLAIRATATLPASGEGAEVIIPITITIPTEKLTLMPDGTDLTGSFSVFAAFLRKDGAVSKVARQPQSFRFPADSLKRRREITVKIDVKADARVDGISVGVMDEASRATGFASVKLTE